MITLPTALTIGSTFGIRARVTDRAGNEGTSSTQSVTVPSVGSAWSITPALASTDALLGSGPLQTGNLNLQHPLDLDQSPGTTVGGSPALAYNSDRVDVHPTISATLQSDNAVALPATITAQLTWNGVAQTAQTFSTTGLNPGDLITVAQQVSSAVGTTGRYTWSLAVTMNYTTPITETLTGVSYVDAEDSSAWERAGRWAAPTGW